MLNFLEHKIYPRVPYWLQNAGLTFYGIHWYFHRFGGVFSQKVLEFKDREFFKKEQWDEFQEKQLRRLLIQASNNVPYYTQLFRELGLNMDDLENFKLSDLKYIPILEKENLRKFGKNELLSTKRGTGKFISSSGTSGTPVSIFLSPTFHQTWSALMETRVRNWADVTYKKPRGMIGGRKIITTSNYKYPLYRYNAIEKQAYFSSYHISTETVEDYLNGLKKHKAQYLTGYASSIFLLAKLFNEKYGKGPKLQAVIVSSEKLTEEMRLTISQAFSCKVFDSYSGSEACGLISESKEGRLLFSPDSGVLELVDENNNYVENGNPGDAVFTGLHNFDQPLIRYRIGDVLIMDPDQKTYCGREMPVVKEIVGRSDDFLVSRDGRKMIGLFRVFYDIRGLKMGQIIQKSHEDIVFNLLTDSDFDKTNSERILKKRIYDHFGEIRVQFEYPNEIAKGPRGKIKSIISHI